MKLFIPALFVAVLVSLTSCSKAPNPFAGTWEFGGGPSAELKLLPSVPGIASGLPSTRIILVLRADGTGLNQCAQSIFPPATQGSLHWKQEGNKLIISDSNFGERVLVIMEKTENTLKVLELDSPNDMTHGTMMVYRRTGDAI